MAHTRTPAVSSKPSHKAPGARLSGAHPTRRATGPGRRRGAPPAGDLPQPPRRPRSSSRPLGPPASARPGPYPLSSSSSSRDWVRSEWQWRHHMVAAAGAGGPGARGPGRAENRPLRPGAAGSRGPGRTTRGPEHPPRDRLADHPCLLVPTAPAPSQVPRPPSPAPPPPPPPRPPGAKRGRAAGMWPGRGRGQEAGSPEGAWGHGKKGRGCRKGRD